MKENIKQLEYIRDQLAWIKSKVQLDNQLGLHDINKLSEDIFMHILNDVYDLNLQNANDMLHDDFPSIDLVDEVNKKVIQVTSTTTLKKARDTVKKLKELKSHKVTDKTSNSLKKSISFFRKLKDYKDYELSFLYINEKPNITKNWTNLLEEEGLSKDNILGIDNILKITQSDMQKCQTVYKTIQQRMDNISFKFNIDSYFEKAEPHLEEVTNSKFKQYEPIFRSFIDSQTKVLKIYAVGGSGKSHLLRDFGKIETEYNPLIFTKQINIEEDLKKLNSSKKYLFIFDDIDRFLDQPILLSLLSYVTNHQNTKLILSYRTASKSIIDNEFRRYSRIDIKELAIIWEQNEIEDLIHSLRPTLQKEKVTKLALTFNNNPYLITQAIRGDIETIKAFSQKIVDDTKQGLDEFNLSDRDLKELLFKLSLVVPISEREIEKYFDKKIIQKLEDIKVLRKLASKYRFNPDMQGDLYLANYIDENQNGFDEKIEELFPIFSDTLFTNLSYALVYNKSDSLQNFIKNIIQKWIAKKEYRNDYLALINKIVYYAPMESFIYLEQATKNLNPQKTNALGMDNMFMQSGIVTTYAPPNGDWSSNKNAINLESIEPIISKLIYALKNNIPCEELKIEHILNYLTSVTVISLPKPYYDNQTLDSIFEKLVFPLDIRNFDVILKTLEIMEKWLDEVPHNELKVSLLKNVLQTLLNATFDNSSSEGFTFTFNKTPLNLEHQGVLSLIKKAKDIVLSMIDSNDEDILFTSLKIISTIGGHKLNELNHNHIEFYNHIKQELLLKFFLKINLIDSFILREKAEKILLQILRFPRLDNLSKEALENLTRISREDEYLFYLMIKGVDFLIINNNKFLEEYKENKVNKENKDFWFDSQTRRRNYNEFSEDELKVVSNLANKYIEVKEFESFLNKLDMSTWNAYQTLQILLNKWFEYKNNIFKKLIKSGLDNINNQIIKNVLNKLFLTKGLRNILLEDINQETSNDDLKVYIDVIFDKDNDSSLVLLNKAIEVIEDKNDNDIFMFISIISQKIYFTIASNHQLYYEFEYIIVKFLQWQLKYKFKTQSYITHHILYNTAKKNDLIIRKDIKDILIEIINDKKIFINEFELKPIYEILEYDLEKVIENLYTKLTSKDENQKPNHMFTHYFDNEKITEVILLKSYIKSYVDFEVLVNKVLEYYSSPVNFIGADGKKYEAYINLDYFFKYTITQDYLNDLFNKYVQENDIKKIKLLYTIVPVSSDYINIIISNLNLLEDEVEDEELINYLKELGKMKTSWITPMENSDLVLSEEALLTEIYNRIDSLPLQVKLKEELKYIEIQKREEIEEDIAYLLGK